MAVPRVVVHRFKPGGAVPNHPAWPLLVYPGAVSLAGDDPASIFERLFTRHGWPAAWRNGVHPFHHFHTSAHEVLGIYSGEVTVRFGGEQGVDVLARPGDVVVLPAGTGHKKLSSRGPLGVVGAYPAGQHADTRTSLGGRREADIAAIARVPRPAMDPVFGATGPLLEHWGD